MAESNLSLYDQNKLDMKDLEAFLNKRAREAQKEWAALNPSKAQTLASRITVNTYIKKPPGHSRKIVTLLVDKLIAGHASSSQKDLLESIEHHFPNEKIYPAVWNKNLEPWALELVKSRIANSSMSHISIKGCKSLSNIKRQFKAAKATETKNLTFKPKITITSKEVFIGKKSYPLMRHGNSWAIKVYYKKKQAWIKLTSLFAFLESQL